MTMTEEDTERFEVEEIEPAPSDEPGEVEPDGLPAEPEFDVDGDGQGEPAPLYQLPEFYGVRPTALVANLKSAKSNRLARLPERGERLVLVVEVLAGDLALNRKDELIQSLDVEDVYPVEADRGQELLREARTSYRLAEDQRLGREELPFDETEAPTAFVAADGTVMLASEVAELTCVFEARGVDIDPTGDVVTVEFETGVRGLWPDDWVGTNQSLAMVGGWMRLPGSKDSDRVVAFYDPDGALKDEWRPEDEAGRLAALEAKLAAEENAAAVAELEAGRGKGAKGKKA